MRAAQPRRLSNVVFMGMGEPLANYDRVWSAVLRLQGEMGLSARHLTLSTVGLVPGIRRLAAETLPVNLAVSLHAANDELRDELVPINRRYPLAALQAACRDYVAASGRRLSIEWALIDGVNDRPQDVAELAGLRPPAGRPRQPHPAQPDPRVPGRGLVALTGARLPRRVGRRGRQRDDPGHPGCRHRRRMRAAGGRSSSAPPAAGPVGPRRRRSLETLSMAKAKKSGVVRPSLFWFLLLDGGIVVLARLALSRSAYEQAGGVSGDRLPPREVLQAMLVGTAVIHAGEAVVAGRMARRRGLSPRGWRLQTLIVGFPSLRALRRTIPA